MKPLKGLSDTSKQPKTKIQAIRRMKLAHGVRNLTKEIITLNGFSFSHKLNVFRYQQLVDIMFNYYNIVKVHLTPSLMCWWNKGIQFNFVLGQL